jgi:uncharacterized protein YjbI with pentapeptide repeats
VSPRKVALWGSTDMSVDNVEELLARFAEGERDFSESELEGANFEGVELVGVDLSRSNLSRANFQAARLDSARLHGACLEAAVLRRASLTDCDLSRANLCEADLTGATLNTAKLDGAFLEGALLIRARLESSDLIGADLSSADLVGASLETADLEGANLSDANLTGANLHWAKLTWANLTNTRLNWARLSWANAEAADFEGANLSGADLQAAKLCCARFTGARLTGANLHFADLCGADLKGVEGQAGLVASVRIDRETYSRSAWTPEQLLEWHAAGATVVDLDSFPVDARERLLSHAQGLRLSFRMPLGQDDRELLIWLGSQVCGPDSTFRITGVEPSESSPSLCIEASQQAALETLADALHRRIWESQNELFADWTAASRERLSELGSAIQRMELLGSSNPDEEDEVHALAAEIRQAEMESAIGPLPQERRACHSWTSLPAIKRVDISPKVSDEDTDPGGDD